MTLFLQLQRDMERNEKIPDVVKSIKSNLSYALFEGKHLGNAGNTAVVTGSCKWFAKEYRGSDFKI